MMDDLISRKAVIEAFDRIQLQRIKGLGLELLISVSDAKNILEGMKAVDAAHVKHGRWEGDETCDAYDVAGVKTWAVKRKCSACGFVHKFIEAHMCYEFCPNCGAKMDLEE